MSPAELLLECPRCGGPGEPHCGTPFCSWLACGDCSRQISRHGIAYRVTWSPDSGIAMALPVVVNV